MSAGILFMPPKHPSAVIANHNNPLKAKETFI